MIVRARHGGNVQLRATEFGNTAIPFPGGGFSHAGRNVNLDAAAGLPAVGAAIGLICDVIAMFDLDAFQEGVDGAPDTPAESSWQDKLFDAPNLDDSEFDFGSDLAAGIEGYGNAFFLKTKNRRGQVLELRPLNPDAVRIRREGGRKVFDVALPNETGIGTGRRLGLTTGDILHVPGFRWPGLMSGLSPIQRYRHALGTALALEEFEGRFFANDASVQFAIQVPGKVGRTQAKAILDVWEATHGGLANAHRPGLLANGADVKQLGLSLKDAQFVEAQKLTTTKVAQIFRVPADLIEGGDTATTERLSSEQLGLRLLTFSILPRLRRIEKALKADRDLFPAGSGLCPKFVTNDLIRLDAVTQAQVHHYEIQDGTSNPNEIRAEKGKPPRDGGDEYVVTPVGAVAPAPNPGETQKPE